jgi:fumarate hydratase subunit beta
MPKKLELPISEAAIRELRIGDEVEISGPIVLGRDAAHKHLIKGFDETFDQLARDCFLYHCGPVVARNPDGGYRFVAAGPTTSIREEPYEATVIERYGLRGIIGKGGMGKRTLEALHRFGCVYLHAIGGLAVVLAEKVVKVHGVHMLDELGVPEAMWSVEVKDFPAVVTMDSHGDSLHERIHAGSAEVARELMAAGGNPKRITGA